MSTHLTNLLDWMSFPEAFIEQLEKMLDLLLTEHNLIDGEVSVILSDDCYLHNLNKTYRAKDVATDVLSFNYLEPGESLDWENDDLAVGDIFISVERAQEQAGEAGHHLHREIFHLAVHGMLHLLGFDHADEETAKLMQYKEQILLKQFDQYGVGGDCCA
ncbi:MAG TPA: rRNA maturation RNase YbeY [Candidatus Limnocylindrales bacterium]|nr:rRNA maturation RNase YbeY [Candidatus Limnocylindrales bacterium]